MSAAVAFLAAILTFSVFYIIIARHERQRHNMVQRLELFSSQGTMAEVFGDSNLTLPEKVMVFVRKTAQKFRAVHKDKSLDEKMQQADWPMFGTEFLVLLLILSLVGGLFVLLLTFSLVKGLIAMLCVGAGVMLYLNIHIARRRAAFVGQLGDTLNMVSNALRAGFSFMQAMELISREMDAPIGTEFQKVINEVTLGSTADEALENMGRRMKSPDFDLVVTAVLIQRQVGGNLSQVLDSISDTINERIRMRNEISALTAQGKLSGVIVGAIPFFIAGYLMAINPEYFDVLLEVWWGKPLLGIALVLEIIAALIIRKIVDIDV